ncbi:MAG TPA: hypothetical protein VHG08_27505, partial [Longimicrobium sp.]|nr:hypothetical protein [Longimicrobium sp.]
MSIFSFPRIHVKGLLAANPGTGNNDDYSTKAVMGRDYPGFETWPLRQADSPNVQPLAYGMTDERWVDWAQKRQRFHLSPAQNPDDSKPGEGPEIDKGEGHNLPAGGPDVWYVPGEWNYYGDMGLFMLDVNVVGVVNGNGSTLHPELVKGARLSFDNSAESWGRSTGLLVDVNAEDVPSSQVLAESLLLARDGKALLAGPPSKAVTRFINFQRNFSLNGPNGAGCLFQSLVPLEQLTGTLVDQLPKTQGGRPLTGLVFRYYLFRPLQEINTFQDAYSPNDPCSPWFDHIEARYRNGVKPTGEIPTPAMTPEEVLATYAGNGQNPDYVQLVGTLAPAYGDEVASCPTGRLLVPSASIPAPGTTGNARKVDPQFRLAPAIVNVDADAQLLSVDFSGTFPDRLQVTHNVYDPLVTDNNPKWDFGPVKLQVTNGQTTCDVAAIDYTDLAKGDAAGWIFDIPFSTLSPVVVPMLQDAAFSFVLTADLCGTPAQLLVEQEYLVVSDQAAIFGEQQPGGPSLDRFISDSGTPTPASIRVFRRGVELTRKECPPVTVWEYDTTPNQAPGNGQILTTSFRPGQPLAVDAQRNGNRLYTFVVQGQAPPPGFSGVRTYTTEPDPPAGEPLYPPLLYGDLPLIVAPMINLRLLPNDEDYSRYYVPGTDPPVGNDLLTFDVIYQKVLRNYYLLYPAMSQQVPLNDPGQWADPVMARRLYERIKLSGWNRWQYMPRTRDLSSSRRTLLQAWALRYFRPDGDAGAST